jgi:hypothetical protein
MEKIKQMALERQIEVLTNLGMQFCIIDTDGNKHGTLEVAEPKPIKKRQSNPDRPLGAVVTYLRPYLDHLQPGSTASIPIGEFGFKTIQSSTCSYLFTAHGPNRVITTQNKDTDCVDVVLV